MGSSLDKQYWAKGTGFGTGSTASSYNMIAVKAKHKSEEKYVIICFALLAEYLDWPCGIDDEEEEEEGEGGVFFPNEDYCNVEMIELMCRSCLLPALASYLLNDSGEGGREGGREGVHIHISIHIRTYIICTYITYIRTYVYTYVCMYIHTYIHTYIRMYIHTYIHTYVCTYIHTYIHTYVCTYIHTYICTYIHTYIMQYWTSANTLSSTKPC